VPLWLAYLDFAAQVKASKRWRRVATRALRLHPTDASLWTLAGRRAAQAGDMERARAHFLRGCRFCNREPTLWVEYARCEMEWLARVEAKKNGKGVRKGVDALAAIKATEAEQEGDVIEFDDEDDESGDDDGLMLPDPDAAEGAGRKKKPNVFDEEETKKLEQSPALNGAIPMAIFDIARKQPFFGAAAADKFFDVFAGFDNVSSRDNILQHVLSAMEELFPNDPCTWSCKIRQPLIGVDMQTPAFPKALRESLARLKGALEMTHDKKLLAAKLVPWVDSILAQESLDEAIRTVLEHAKRSLELPLT
jgi:U3 small nucleolar RNA-associated protein 6